MINGPLRQFGVIAINMENSYFEVEYLPFQMNSRFVNTGRKTFGRYNRTNPSSAFTN